MDKHTEQLLNLLYYSSNSAYNSATKLYDAVKLRGVSYKDVKEWIEKQKSYQLFKKPVRVKKHFPITAGFKNEKWQCDLMDMQDIASANSNYKYNLVCIDVFSRFLWVVPMKNKQTQTVIDSMKKMLRNEKPNVLICDLGSEFISSEFKKLMKENGIQIQFKAIDDHRALGIVDRVIRNLREKINSYQEKFNTMKYIDVLPDIVRGYNSSYHSGIKKTPEDVKQNDADIVALNLSKYTKALSQETKFKVGDRVRYMLNFEQFQKHTLPRWTKTVHKIVEEAGQKYKLENGHWKRYDELQLIKDVYDTSKNLEATREQIQTENKSKRNFKRSGLDLSFILNTKRKPKVVVNI